MLVLILLLQAHLSAQSIDQWITWGDASMAKQEYYGASRFYAGALALEPGRMSLQWKQAEACRLSNQYPQAADLYSRVYQKDAGRAYPDALKWLGEMQLCDGRYDEARSTWEKVLQKEKDKTSILARRALNALAGCDKAGASKPLGLEISHLPGPVNTNDSEFGARSGPDSLLWFSSLRGDLNDDGEVQDTAAYRVGIYSSRPNMQGWNEPVREEGQPDAMGHSNANLMWTATGDRMYFTMLDPDGTKQIATRTPNSPAQIITGLEAHPDATQPWVAVINGKTLLLFAASGGQGGMDIWYGDLNGTTVTNIQNAGQLVNSPGNEVSPSFDESAGILWFSSDFHAGLGGYDIFKVDWKNDPDGIENVLDVNSPANDLYPVYDATSGKGWFTSNRKGSFAAKGETCCNDIYRIQGAPAKTPVDTLLVADTIPADSVDPMTPESANVKSLPTRMQIEFPLKLYFHNDEPEPRTRLKSTRQTYGAIYSAYTTLIPTYRNENTDPTAIEAFFRDEAEIGRKKLDALVQALIPALESGERIILDVRGHASPLAKNDYNRDLSLRRIESLRNHLRTVENGRLISYMDSSASNGGLLRLRVLPFGEDRAATGVSDDLNDLKRSVYSAEAARERRIEVERIHVEQRAIRLSQTSATFDLGTVRQGVPQRFQVPVVNDGTTPLRIVRGRSSCDCVMVEATPPPIPPGGTGTIELHYSGRTRPGPLDRLIELEIEGSNTPYLLNIVGNVIQ
jgi:outer membrane protein OmpA-like peptidoglycan-associated protein